MRLSLFRLFALLLCLQLGVGQAVAGSMTLLGVGKPSASAPTSPVVSFVSQSGTTGAGSTTITATAVDIGNPAYIATRRVFIVIQGGAGSATPSLTSTINGVTIDQATSLSSGCASSECVEFISAPVPSGTTGVTITINYSATVFTNPNLSIYTADNSLLSSKVPIAGFSDNTSGAGTNTTTINTTTKAGGFILAGTWIGGGAGPSITASTETYTSDYSSTAYFSAHANGISSNASNSVSTQGPPAGGNSGLGLAAWR